MKKQLSFLMLSLLMICSGFAHANANYWQNQVTPMDNLQKFTPYSLTGNLKSEKQKDPFAIQAHYWNSIRFWS
jgi:hypothetical protein